MTSKAQRTTRQYSGDNGSMSMTLSLQCKTAQQRVDE